MHSFPFQRNDVSTNNLGLHSTKKLPSSNVSKMAFKPS